MTNITLYPELIDYIYDFCGEFKTNDEKLAGKTILYNTKNMDERMRKMIITKGWFSDADHIKAMISDGYEPFKRKVVERIFNEHRNDLNLNLCPKCFKIARTPKARQCRFCFYNWH